MKMSTISVGIKEVFPQYNKLQLKNDVYNARFPYKLWLLIHQDGHQVVTWGRGGKSVVIDFSSLENYLLTDESIFRTKNISSFVRQLHLYGFQKCGNISISLESTDVPVFNEYEHNLFLKNRPDLLTQIYRLNGLRQFGSSTGTKKYTDQRRADPCLMKIPNLSKLTKARLNLSKAMEMQMLIMKLDEKMLECQNNNGATSVIDLPLKYFHNPFESTSGLQTNDFAGYYGNVPTEKIKQFFGDYLPTFSAPGSDVNITQSDVTMKESHLPPRSKESDVPMYNISLSESLAPTPDIPVNNFNAECKVKYTLSYDANNSDLYTLIINNGNEADESQYPPKTEVTDNQEAVTFTESTQHYDNVGNNSEEDLEMDQYLTFKGPAMQEYINFQTGEMERIHPDNSYIINNEASCSSTNVVKVNIDDIKTEDEQPDPLHVPPQLVDDNSSNITNWLSQIRQSIDVLYN